MPLRDHFHAPLSQRRHPEGLHAAWINSLLRQVVERLPPRYYAEPQVRLGVQVAPDVAAFHEDAQVGDAIGSGNGVATAVWTAAAPSHTVEVDLVSQDVVEIQVHDTERAAQVVAVIELVSRRNKDRPDARRDFVVKCASYLQQQVSVIIVDVVTDRQHDLYGELMTLLGAPREADWPGDPPVYAVAIRSAKPGEQWRLEAWEEALSIGATMPTLPLWLASDLAVPVDLEASYEETCRVLRIP